MQQLRSIVLLACVLAFCLSVPPSHATSSSSSKGRAKFDLTRKATPYEHVRNSPYNVSYDSRAILINGERVLLQGGSVHYARLPPSMWSGVLDLVREHGLNLVQTYTLWNYHEAQQGVFDFETGSRNIAQFLQECADKGLFVNLRIGPYACAEWNLGGIPSWLKLEPGVEFRTENDIWLTAMQTFVKKILEVVEPYLARNGGPIILAQIENEYGNVESYYGTAGQKYVQDVAQFALDQNIEIPWIMCQQADAPSEIINTCNGFYCDNWIETHAAANPNQPHMFTEDWNGWFQLWGEAVPHRPIEDNMFAVLRWFMRGGTFHNYYMVFGGTNFDRWVGGPYIVTSYDYDVAIDEYGLPNPAKFNQSRTLHHFLTLYSDYLLRVDSIPVTVPLAPNAEAIEYKPSGSTTSVIFLANINTTPVTVNYPLNSTNSFTLPAWSVSIVDPSGDVVFNTFSGPFIGREEQQKGHSAHFVEHEELQHKTIHKPRRHTSVVDAGDKNYLCFTDYFGIWNQTLAASAGPLPQIATTGDTTDYLFYILFVDIDEASISRGYVNVTLSNVGDYFHVQLMQGSGQFGPSLKSDAILATAVGNASESLLLKINSQWSAGSAILIFLSQTLGLQNYGPFLESVEKGVLNTSLVMYNGVNLNSPTNVWYHQVGLYGETLSLSSSNVSSPYWQDHSTCASNSPATLMWYLIELEADLSDPTAVFAIDMKSMNKGTLWINGIGLGRYWTLPAVDDNDCQPCSYIGSYDPSNCRTGCGEPSQRYYHVPREFLQQGNNTVVVSEQQTTSIDPSGVQLVRMN